jgi:hypothetical protein
VEWVPLQRGVALATVRWRCSLDDRAVGLLSSYDENLES